MFVALPNFFLFLFAMYWLGHDDLTLLEHPEYIAKKLATHWVMMLECALFLWSKH